MTDTHFGSSTNQIAHAVSLDTNHANALVAAGVETCWSPFDHGGGEMHDVFIVITLVVYFLYGVYLMGATW
jgi:hypothetical protein